MQRSWLPLAVLVAVVAPTAAAGQDDVRPQRGFLFEVSASIGEMDCELCDGGADGFGLAASLAWRLDPRALLGITLSGFSATYDRNGTVCLFPVGCGESRSTGSDLFATLVPALRVYPFPRVGLFLHGGVGLGVVTMNDPDVFADFFEPAVGVGTSVGLGFEVGAGRGYALTPRIIRSEVLTTGRSTSVVEIGLALTYR